MHRRNVMHVSSTKQNCAANLLTRSTCVAEQVQTGVTKITPGVAFISNTYKTNKHAHHKPVPGRSVFFFYYFTFYLILLYTRKGD